MKMKRQYQVTFSKDGRVLSRSIQIAANEKQAIEFARMYHSVWKAEGRAVPVSELEEAE